MVKSKLTNSELKLGQLHLLENPTIANTLNKNNANLLESELRIIVSLIKTSYLAKMWLIIGICALAIAGLFSVLLVIFRMPGLQSLFPHNFFYPALVVHVNLSVLVWLLSISAVLWVSISSSSFYYITLNAIIIVGTGIILVSVSPFVGGKGVMNNYVPILNNFTFALGISLFICGIFLQVMAVIMSYKKSIKNSIVNLIIYSIALICLLAMVSAIISYYDLKHNMAYVSLEYFYEMLFWSAGHILQFAFTQLMQFAWIIMLVKITKTIPKYFIYPFIINVVSVLPCILIHFIHPIDDWQFKQFFTGHMIIFGGIAPVIMIVMILKNLYRQNCLQINDYLFSIIYSSIILFLAGGIIGFMIHGANVIIPAHYHGAIGSVTIACMGVAYMIVADETGHKYKIIKWHPYLQAGGQLLHIIGLTWSGGYGVLRKNPGEEAVKAKIAMSFMGIGGIFSISGGIIFVIIMILLILNTKLNKVDA